MLRHSRCGARQQGGAGCDFCVQVAIAATRAATDAPPHARTEVYGSRALDVCFDTGGMGDDGTALVAHLLRVPSEVGQRQGIGEMVLHARAARAVCGSLRE